MPTATNDPYRNFQPGREHINALARTSLGFFARGAMKTLLPAVDILWAPYLDLIAAKLEDVMNGKCRRLIINIPPRYGKSLMASIAFPAFILGRRPNAEVVCISYAQSLAERMARDTLRLMQSEYYIDIFGNRLASAREPVSDIKTRQGGCRFATSTSGTLTGRGGNVLIIDDPLKPEESKSDVKRSNVNDWFDSTVLSRPNNKGTDAIVIIMQRLHEDDLVGHLVAKGGWEVISLPAIAEEDETHVFRSPFRMQTWIRKEGEALHPERESLECLAELRAGMSAYDIAAQYQQRPAPAGGGDIEEAWFQKFDPQNPPKFERVIQAWDTASKEGERNDYSACATIGETANGHYYVLDLYRARLRYPDLKRKARELAELHNASTVVIEDSSSGTALIQDLMDEGFRRIEMVKAAGNKYERIRANTGLMQACKVWIPEQAHWAPGFLHEAAMFPAGRHDDQLDALAHGLHHLRSNSGPQRWLATMDELDRRRGLPPRLDPDDYSVYSVSFDHPDPNIEFKVSTGRWVKRGADGAFHVTPDEWNGVKNMHGVRLVHHPDPDRA